MYANVPTLAAVACDSTQNITNIEIRLEWTAFFRRKNQAQAIAANVCWRMALFLAIQFLFSSDFSIPFFHCFFLCVNSLNIKKIELRSLYNS
jgi:hypothetical protein